MVYIYTTIYIPIFQVPASSFQVSGTLWYLEATGIATESDLLSWLQGQS